MFNKYPIAELEQTHTIPWAKVDLKEKVVKNREILQKADTVNQTLKLRNIRNGNFISNKGNQM
jgi:hypothetical protein